MNQEFLVDGVPLQAQHAQKYILTLFSGKKQGIARRQMLDSILKHHCDQGGSPPSGPIVATVKQALSGLKTAGLARNSSGYWWFKQSLNEDFANKSGSLDGHIAEVDSQSNLENKESPSNDHTPCVELGTGPQTIYAYYFPSYRELASHKRDDRWPMKIGKAAVDVQTRIREQGVTALPEAPVIAFTWKMENADQAERALHGILSVMGRSSNQALGSEWFLTNPEELEALVTKSGLDKLFDA